MVEGGALPLPQTLRRVPQGEAAHCVAATRLPRKTARNDGGGRRWTCLDKYDYLQIIRGDC